MDFNLSTRHSASNSKISAIDVSQLDKINAIPNKNAGNVLLDGLHQEDQLYLNALMEEDSSDSDEDEQSGSSRRPNSVWSPMAQSPMMLMGEGKGKRIRRMRPSYAVTLSLEDISYIRPSWGISKGVKKIEIKRKKERLKIKDSRSGVTRNDSKDRKSSSSMKQSQEKLEEDENLRKESASLMKYYGYLTFVIMFMGSLVALTHFIDSSRHKKHISDNRMRVDPLDRKIEIFHSKIIESSHIDTILSSTERQHTLRVDFGRGIPQNLKSQECSCEEFEVEAKKFNNQPDMKRNESDSSCLACLDWSMRANFQVIARRDQVDGIASTVRSSDESDAIKCYDVRWQSYDKLWTPIIDCFLLKNDEQWFGLGDIQTPHWPISKFPFCPTALTANLASEFESKVGGSHMSNCPTNLGPHFIEPVDPQTPGQLQIGSYVNFSLFSSNGFYFGNLKSDLRPLIWLTKSDQMKELCLSVSCADQCTQSWSRDHLFSERRLRNSYLEYQICSGSTWRDLISKHLRGRVTSLAKKFINESHAGLVQASLQEGASKANQKGTVTESATMRAYSTTNSSEPRDESALIPTTRHQQSIVEGIGLIERTIFATSQEFIPTLDGQTLRQFVDSIVKLGLKTSPILLIDSRWQIHTGSLKLNSALFPKAKLLFEILHNKGFKIVLTVKPYIDSGLSMGYINSLTKTNRTYLGSPVGPRPGMTNVTPNKFSHARYQHGESEPHVGVQEQESLATNVTRRVDFFSFVNETVWPKNEDDDGAPLRSCKDSVEGYCAFFDVCKATSRDSLVELIKKSNWLIRESDGILVAGAHPDASFWEDHFRSGLAKLIDRLFYEENLYTIPEWTDNFGYMQLAHRTRDWQGLESTLESLLNLNALGFTLVNPGSVWGDLKSSMPSDIGDQKIEGRELAMRWLQLAIFLPILQFKDLTPIEEYSLHEQLLSLTRIRKLHVVPEIKKHLLFSPLVGDVGNRQAQARSVLERPGQLLPVIQHVWQGLSESGSDYIVSQQFFVGTDIMVAPILRQSQRSRDIYLPSGFWRDELKQTNIRGGRWMRNYPIQLDEIAWFTRARR